jgi:hypothetical protein
MMDNQKPREKAGSGSSQQEISQEGNLPKDSPTPVTGFSQKGQVPTIRDSQPQHNHEHSQKESLQEESLQEHGKGTLSETSSTTSSQTQRKQMPVHNTESSSTIATNSGYKQTNDECLQTENQRLNQEEVKRLKQIEKAHQEIIGQNKCSDNYQAQAWWDNYRQQPTDNDLLFVRKYPHSVILLLEKLQRTLVSERKSWSDWWTGNDKTIKNLEREVKKLTAELERKQERITALEGMEADYSSIHQKNVDLELRCTRLIKEITTLKTGEDAPRAEGLHSAFKELKDQAFKELSNKVYKLRTQCNPSAKVERKQETAIIRSKLAEAVLMGSVDICKEGNVTEAETDKLIKSVNGKFIMYFSSFSCPDVKTKFPTESQEITQALESIARKSLKLVNDIIHTSPPGELLWYKKDDEFNCEEHEVLVGCAEKGKITFTVFPGYAVYEGNTRRIFEKAMVFTKLAEK